MSRIGISALARIALALIGFLSAIVGWPLLTAACILALSLRYRAYEVLVIGLLADFLWQPAGAHIPYFTLGALVAVWIFEPVRTEFLR
jgi:hypothetical protein